MLSDGSRNDYQIGQTLGFANERGRALVSYEYFSEDALDANDKSFTRTLPDPYEILPDSKRHSAFFSGGVSLGAGVEAFSDLFHNKRVSEQLYSSGPFQIDSALDVEQSGGTLGLTIPMYRDWQAEVSGSLAKSRFESTDSLLRPMPSYGGFVMATDTRTWSIDSKIDGALFQSAGGVTRAVVGAQYREETHDGGMKGFDGTGNFLGGAQAAADTARDVTAVFAEIYAPVFGANNALPGLRSLALSMAARYEDYSDFGSSFNPKFGVSWSPHTGLTFRGSYGTSFRAPRLQQMVDIIDYVSLIDYVDPVSATGRSVAFMVSGQTTDLDPEESTSWTAGFEFEPAFAPSLSFAATYFDIDYTGRIEMPFPKLDTSTYEYYNYPLPVIRSIDPAALQTFLDAAVLGLFNDTTALPTGSHSELADATILIDGRPTNTAASRVSGVDASVTWHMPLAGGSFKVSSNGSYLIGSEDRFSVLQPVVKKVGRVFNPSRFRMRSGAAWSNEATSIGMYLNYVHSYDDDQVIGTARRVSSWTTFDVAYRYEFGSTSHFKLIANTALTFSVRNILDKDPPRIATEAAPGNSRPLQAYDSANADPQGRSIGLQLTKMW